MFEIFKGGRQSLGEQLREAAELEKQAAALREQIKVYDDLQKLIYMAIKCKRRGDEGFYIPPELAYLADELQMVLDQGEDYNRTPEEILEDLRKSKS